MINYKSFLFASLLPLGAAAQVPNFTITGKIGNMDKPAKVYLDYTNGETGREDSAVVVNGVFSFSGYTPGISTARMSLDHTGEGKQASIYKGNDNIYFYFAEDHMTVTSADSLINAQVKGSETYDGYDAYNKEVGGPIMKLDRIANAEVAAGTPEQRQDTNFIKGIDARFRQSLLSMKQKQMQFAKDHPESFFGLVALSEAGAINSSNVATAEPIFDAIDEKWRATTFGKALAQKIKAAHVVVAGQQAPLFTLPDVKGKSLSLGDLKGKVVLIDFWASWCEPCRAESPNLKTQYALYKDKGFEIISVSIDTDKKNWLKAISDDGLTWLQVSDLKGYNSTVVRSYGIGGVPSFFLLGRDGKIIANANLQGDALNQRLASIFKD
jgi:peroxiredoxin